MNSYLIPIESEEESVDESEIEKKVINLNHLAMKNLELQRSNHVLIYLNQALLACKLLKSIDSQSRLLALTYNNLACYFQSIKSSEKALEFLFKSVKLLTNSKDITNLAASHLNISYILLSQGQDERSLRHSLKTIYLLRNRSKASVTLIKAYLAAGNLYKNLQQSQDASDCYEKGLSLSRKYMGCNYDLTLQFKAALESLKLETLSKQKTSKIISKLNPVLHRRSRTGFEDLQKVKPVKNNSKSSQRTRLIQEKMINTGRTLTSYRMRTRNEQQSRNSFEKVKNFEFKRDSCKAATEIDLESEKDLRNVKVKQRLSQDLNDLEELKELRELKGMKQSLEISGLDKIDEFLEISEKKEKELSRNYKKIRFDIQNQRMQEKLAAVFLQAWWKGRRQRLKFLALKEEKEIEVAEAKAKEAADYALKLRLKASARNSPRKVARFDMEKMNFSALIIQKVFRGFKGRSRFKCFKESFGFFRVVVANFLVKSKRE